MRKTTATDFPKPTAPANPSRRRFLKTTAAASLAAAAGSTFFSRSAAAATGRPIKIGFITPRTGAIAEFAKADDWIIENMRNMWAKGLVLNGVVHPVVIIDKDSRSDPNRAAEVASSLIKSDKVDLILTGDTVDTVNPVADQAEINGVPCVTTNCPWQPYYFGRGGTPAKGFDWSYHFFWGNDDTVAVCTSMWASIPTNKVVGALWANDPAGNSYADAKQGFPPTLKARGFTLIDPGRFSMQTTDFSAQIATFKAANVEIVSGSLTPPAFSIFWQQAAQQGFRPKIVTVGRALFSPGAVESLGDRAAGLTAEVWWSKYHPFKSSLTGLTATQWCDQYERLTGKQWAQFIGFKHALFEVAADALKRTKDIDSPESIRDAIAATNLDTIVGHLQWSGKPVKNVCRTVVVGGQWVKGKKFKYDLILVGNENAPNIPLQGKLKAISYN
jgi:branched-chain amino acid transport system substrate-binding protein